MKKTQHFSADWLGAIAHETLDQHRSGVILGTTSRGFFIQPPGKWLLFISTEEFRGPLTINLHAQLRTLKNLTTRLQVDLGPDRISISALEFSIHLDEAAVWRPAARDGAAGPDADRKKRMVELASKVYNERQEVGLSPLLPLLFGIPEHPHGKNHHQTAVLEELKTLVVSTVSGKPFPLNEALTRALGLGSGLTPAGDDFILGAALALNRWSDPLLRDTNPALINRTLVEAAYLRTTTLSANLIECAARGMADERLIAGLDWIMTGAGRFCDVANGILGWGNNSGIAVLAGMGIAMIAQIE